MSKPTKLSVAFYVEDGQGRFTAVKRLKDDDSLPNMWGLPAASLCDGENFEMAVGRAAKEKLGIRANKIELEGEMEIEREKHNLTLREYRVTNYDGTLALRGGDKYYAKLAWQDDPEILREAADNGSLCSRIFLINRGLWTGGIK